MEKINEATQYFRKNKRNNVVIYVRGNNETMQEIICKLYAVDNDYRVLYVTRHLEDVNLCDTMLIANPSRISRDRIEYEKIVKDLNTRGIKVESVVKNDSDIYNIFTA